ncbi:hypothetical protein P3342_009075 [Pyrenophora teres f. teres]|nr:hypothetical protein P3342_009075 [Pyrenophora teres f. teres]
MPREAEISLNEREFIKQALQEQIRIDRRAFDAFRPLELTFGDEYGVADVQLGKTRVIARISVDVTTPLPERKFDGIFQIVTEFSPMASPAFEVGRPTDSEVILSRILEKPFVAQTPSTPNHYALLPARNASPSAPTSTS